MSRALLEVEDLTVRYGHGPSAVTAVDRVSFKVERGSTFGLVGESGCGKSTIAATVMMLNRPQAGSVIFDHNNLADLTPRDLRAMRRRIQIIFQDAAASLNPRLPIHRIIGEALTIHGLHTGAARPKRIKELLDLVGIPSYMAGRYPHELSGGQAQRVAICRALAVEPELIVCDEATSALDVSIQAQIVNLLQDLQAALGLTYIFVSHDLSVVRHISDVVAVMYAGRIVEISSKTQLFEQPTHPYTRALLSAVSVPDPRMERLRTRAALDGEPPDPARPPPGCRFSTRCGLAVPSCASMEPALEEMGAGHWVRCPVTAPLSAAALPHPLLVEAGIPLNQ
jgi:oligopeptide transport system ATP-binding protein